MDFDNPADLITLNSIYDADDLANEGISMDEVGGWWVWACALGGLT